MTRLTLSGMATWPCTCIDTTPSAERGAHAEGVMAGSLLPGVFGKRECRVNAGFPARARVPWGASSGARKYHEELVRDVAVIIGEHVMRKRDACRYGECARVRPRDVGVEPHPRPRRSRATRPPEGITRQFIPLDRRSLLGNGAAGLQQALFACLRAHVHDHEPVPQHAREAAGIAPCGRGGAPHAGDVTVDRQPAAAPEPPRVVRAELRRGERVASRGRRRGALPSRPRDDQGLPVGGTARRGECHRAPECQRLGFAASAVRRGDHGPLMTRGGLCL